MRRLALVLTGVLITAVTADAARAADCETLSRGLQYRDEIVCTGPAPRACQTLNVHYTGWLYDHGAKGAQFDSSRDRGKPFSF